MADDEQFSLCWNNFNSNLSAGFHESLCRGDLVDVTLAAEGQLVKAHRLVLSVCSPYFRKMFTQMPANQHAFVFLKDVSHSALKDLIQFMYCGEVNVKQEALPAFISTAEALQIKGLTDSDPPAQTPSEPTTPTPQIPQIQTSPRIRQQRTAASTRSYKIETVDETSNDSKPQTTQIVIQTTAAPVSQPTAITITQPATVVHHHQQQHHIQAQQHHHQQQLQSQSHQLSAVSIPSGGVSSVATTTTHVVGSSNKRPAQRSSLGSANHIKRTKSSTVDPLEGADVNASGAVSAAAQQITIQTAIVSDTKAQQQQNETAEYIDLPLDLPTKSEPDYTDDTGEVDPNEQDATYVEDESYGDMRYDESYFTENEDGGGGGGVVTTGSVTTTAGNINVSNTSNAGNVNIGIGNVTGGGGIGGPAAATTSKAIVKQQQSTSFSDSSYADGTDQTNNDAQEQESTVAVYSATSRGRVQLIYGGQPFIYEKKIKLSNNQEKKYWRCNQWWNQKCRSRVCTINDMVMPLNRYHTHEEIVRRKKRVRKNVAGAATVNSSGSSRAITVTESGAAPSNNIKLATTNQSNVTHVVTHAGDGGIVGGGGNDSNIDVSTLSMHLKYEEIVADVTEISDTTAIFIAKK